MHETSQIQLNSVIDRIARLLGLSAVDPEGSIVLTCLVAPCNITVGACYTLNRRVKLPAELIVQVDRLGGPPARCLPPKLGAVVVRAATIFSLAAALFGSDEKAHAWWLHSMRLFPGVDMKPPAEWVAEAASANELSRRMRLTEGGIF